MTKDKESNDPFQAHDGETKIYRAPGRINLIGEHTDYNDGFVMPAAIDLAIWVAISDVSDRTISVSSENFHDQFSFDLDDQNPRPKGDWSDYVRGVAVMLERAGHRLRGARLHIRGDVPVGAGLGSSAAVEVAIGYALLKRSALPVNRLELAKLCQQAENEFVGIGCGIMDQFIACHGQEGKAVLLDCRSLEAEPLRLPDDVRLVICNTMVKHQLAATEYNARREECEQGVRQIAQGLPMVRALRDLTLTDLELHGRSLPNVIYRRCYHVISENDRVLRAKAALEENKLLEFGQLMNESHQSLRDDYEVSCPELDLMVELARDQPGVFGARMTGGGFGGCTINLVRAEACENFSESVSRNYQAATGIVPEIYICRAVAGVDEAISSPRFLAEKT